MIEALKWGEYLRSDTRSKISIDSVSHRVYSVNVQRDRKYLLTNKKKRFILSSISSKRTLNMRPYTKQTQQRINARKRRALLQKIKSNLITSIVTALITIGLTFLFFHQLDRELMRRECLVWQSVSMDSQQCNEWRGGETK